MDIPELSMALSASKVQSDWGTAMLANNLDALAEAGKSIEEMMDVSALERSVNPNLGGTIDIRL
ncbi:MULTISPECIES: YjfB family protein [unclassified Butyrivibrio]|uniref:YjfB family protein n=1 Tax=unclassified Butyrivibrio TaxID=2639466 RepID=UPI0003F4B1C9|nr:MULTISPECIES: YjfB family protein [unclassified Butyrivibrio]